MMKKIIKLDASALKLSACRLELVRTVLQGYRIKKSHISLDYGTAFHDFKENLSKSGNYFLALSSAQQKLKELLPNSEVPKEKDFLTLEHLTKTCLEYVKIFGEKREKDEFVTLVRDEKTAVELKFAIPYRSTPEVDVLLCGTIDDIGQFKNGCYAFGDEKTSGDWKITSYFDQYELSTQLLFYRFCIEWMGANNPDSIYGEITKQRLGAFINGVFYKRTEDTKFIRSKVIFFPQSMLDEFKILLDEKIDNLIYDCIHDNIPHREGLINGSCVKQYGKLCRFFRVCSAPDEVSRDLILKNHFIQKEYNPLLFGGGDKGVKE